MKNLMYIFLSLSFTMSSCIKISQNEILDETIYVRHQGADMPAYVHGNPENKTFLIVIHGAGSFGLSFRDENFIKKIEDEYVVVYFDNRAQSMSQGNFYSTNNIIKLMAEDVEALTEVIKHKYGEDNSFFLMGHSLGGLITGKALLKQDFQENFKGWINVDGVFDMPNVMAWRVELLYEVADEQIALGNSIHEWEAIEETLGEIDFDRDEAYSEVFDLIVKAYAIIVQDDQVNTPVSADRIYNTILVNNPLTWKISHLFHKPELTARLEDYTIIEEINQIKLPSLFTYGKYDFSVPPQSGFYVFQEMSSGHDKFFSLYDRTTHHPFVTESGRFTTELKNFIEAFK